VSMSWKIAIPCHKCEYRYSWGSYHYCMHPKRWWGGRMLKCCEEFCPLRARAARGQEREQR